MTDQRPPVGLSARGKALWAELVAEGELTPSERTLAAEACRVADRLEVLDQFLRGTRSTWLHMVPETLDGSVVAVRIDGALSEGRQQQLTLRALLAELRTSRAARAKPAPMKPAAGTPTPPAQPGATADAAATPGPGGSVLSFASALAARRPGSAS